MAKRAQRLGAGVPLPDDVDMPHRHVDLLACQHLGCKVVQNAVAHVDRIGETEQQTRRLELLGEVLEE